jgi:hypothetical protein
MFSNQIPNHERVEILFHIIWIITEADRSATTVLLPAEY